MLKKIGYFREKLLDYLIPPFSVTTRKGPAFFAYSYQKATIFKGQYICQLIDPLISNLENDNYTNIIVGKVPQPEAISSQQVPHKITWSEFIFSVFFFHKQIFSDYKFLVTLQRPMRNYPSLMPKNLNPYLFTIRTLLISNYFAIKVREIATQADSAYVLVYSNAIMLGVVSAFRRLGKEAWDVQHGLLGCTHPAYNNSDAYLRKSTFRPSGFLVWDAKFGEYLEKTLGAQWKSTDYIHLKAFGKAQRESKIVETVLYSLQWGTPVPVEVKSAIRHFSDIRWILRKHPLEKSPRHDLEWIEEFPNAKLTDSTQPLIAVLSESDLHITYNSSVIFEAAKLGVKSFLVSPDNYQAFPNPIHNAFSDIINVGMASIVPSGKLISLMTSYIKCLESKCY